MNTAIISIAEADAYLSAYTLWTALTDPEKTHHLTQACVYVQTQWVCEDVVYEDDPDTTEVEVVSIPDEVKEAVAYYAYANSQGTLYGDPAVLDVKRGNLRSERKTLDKMTKEVSYFRGGSLYPFGTTSALGYPDSLMSVHGVSKDSVAVDVIRA